MSPGVTKPSLIFVTFYEEVFIYYDLDTTAARLIFRSPSESPISPVKPGVLPSGIERMTLEDLSRLRDELLLAKQENCWVKKYRMLPEPTPPVLSCDWSSSLWLLRDHNIKHLPLSSDPLILFQGTLSSSVTQKFGGIGPRGAVSYSGFPRFEGSHSRGREFLLCYP